MKEEEKEIDEKISGLDKFKFSRLKSLIYKHEDKHAEVEHEQEPETQEFAEAKLSDGTVLSIDPALEIAGTVTVTSEEGETLIEDGEHELENGDIIVTEAGIIVDILVLQEQTEEKDNEQIAQLNKRLDVFKDSYTSLQKKHIKLQGEFEKLTNLLKEQEEINQLFYSAIESFGKQPQVEPVEKNKNPFASKATKSVDLKALAKKFKR